MGHLYCWAIVTIKYNCSVYVYSNREIIQSIRSPSVVLRRLCRGLLKSSSLSSRGSSWTQSFSTFEDCDPLIKVMFSARGRDDVGVWSKEFFKEDTFQSLCPQSLVFLKIVQGLEKVIAGKRKVERVSSGFYNQREASEGCVHLIGRWRHRFSSVCVGLR